MADQLSGRIASQQRSETPSWASLPHVTSSPARVGIFGIGLATYWTQFPGLKERLEGYQLTILTVTQTAAGRLKFIVAEGEAQAGPILRIGNTNSRLKFSLPPAEFMDQWCSHGPTHHCALGVGHHVKEIVKIGRLLGIEVALVA